MSGLIALAGALCWAELATVFPRQGGTYIFIKEGLGDLPAFVYIYMRSVLSITLTNSHWLRSGAGQTYSPLIGRWCPAPAAPYSRSRDFDQSSICLSQSAISDFNKKLAYSV